MEDGAWRLRLSPLDEAIGFWSVDLATGRVTLDALMSECFGIAETEGARGVDLTRLLDRIHPDDRGFAIPKMNATVGRGSPFSFVYRLRVVGGDYERVRAIGRRFADPQGTPTHAAGILVSDTDTDAFSPPTPVEIQVIELLMQAHDLAGQTSDAMLPRLIAAVLLHAGRELSKGIDPSDLG